MNNKRVLQTIIAIIVLILLFLVFYGKGNTTPQYSGDRGDNAPAPMPGSSDAGAKGSGLDASGFMDRLFGGGSGNSTSDGKSSADSSPERGAGSDTGQPESPSQTAEPNTEPTETPTQTGQPQPTDTPSEQVTPEPTPTQPVITPNSTPTPTQPVITPTPTPTPTIPMPTPTPTPTMPPFSG